MASTLPRISALLSGAAPSSTSRVSTPAAKAPSSTSRPNACDRPSIAASSSTTKRTANWPLLCSVLAIRRGSHAGGGRIARTTAPAVIAPNATRRAADSAGLRPLRSSAMAMTGPNSPTAPNAIVTSPKRPFSSPPSFSTGRTVPSAVLVSAVPTTKPVKTSPPLSSNPRPSPAAREISQAPSELRRRPPRTLANSIS
ncbi:hypothetical protein GCM10010497_28510 [Streptomyces cinereoruber]|uniref:Uncharacterized protein n=1 Tax=Streptomyces cinereoruber TaxID=67260 RepID=A0AAV4KI19_9ACTN|nr:hypothetical protein GCM10010497_28510 [Streptomyces cinereoruber]